MRKSASGEERLATRIHERRRTAWLDFAKALAQPN
jgi:hypothetical protein